MLRRSSNVILTYLAAAQADLRCLDLSLEKEAKEIVSSRISGLADFIIKKESTDFRTALEIVSGTQDTLLTIYDWLTSTYDPEVNKSMKEMFDQQASIIEELYVPLEDVLFSNPELLEMGNIGLIVADF